MKDDAKMRRNEIFFIGDGDKFINFQQSYAFSARWEIKGTPHNVTREQKGPAIMPIFKNTGWIV